MLGMGFGFRGCVLVSPSVATPLSLLSRGRGRGGLGGVQLIEAVERLGWAAVDVEPPVADEVLLVEDGAVRAEEGVLVKAGLPLVVHADVERLAIRLGVGVVASWGQPVADEGGVGNLGEDGIVVARGPGDVLDQGLEGVVLSHGDHEQAQH